MVISFHFLICVQIIFSKERFHWICYNIVSAWCFGFLAWHMGSSSTITDGTQNLCVGRWSLTLIPKEVPVFMPFHPVILNHLAFLWLPHNLLTHSLKTLCNISYLEHVLLCANSKCVFQASTVTLCNRQDLVSFLSGTQLWAWWWWAQRRSCSSRWAIEWMNQSMDSCVGGEGMVYV